MTTEDNASGQTDTAAGISNDRSITTTDPAKRQGRGLVLLALILAVGALGVAALSNQRVGGIDDLQTTVAGQQQQLDELGRRLDRFDVALSGLEEKSAAQVATAGVLQEKLETLGQTVGVLRQRDATTDPQLILVETEQLMVLATQRLSLGRDAETALAAMQLADQRLSLSEDPKFIDLRGTIAADMNAIQSVNRPDITGMSIYLADLVTRVDTLPLKHNQEKISATIDTTQPPAEDTRPAWRRLLDAIWGELRGLLVISTENTDPADFLPPEQRYFLQLNLRLQLESARLSLLLGDTENFQSAVTLSRTWLDRYFAAGNAGVAAILESLDLMNGIDLKPDLPDLSASLDAIRSMREELQTPRPDPTAPEN